jgi:hypothetical protein
MSPSPRGAGIDRENKRATIRCQVASLRKNGFIIDVSTVPTTVPLASLVSIQKGSTFTNNNIVAGDVPRGGKADITFRVGSIFNPTAILPSPLYTAIGLGTRGAGEPRSRGLAA